MDAQEIRAKHKQYLWPCVMNYYKEPIVITEGKGIKVKDVAGKEYIDFFGGILTTSISHGQEEIRKKIHEQVDKLLHASTLYPYPAMVEYAQILAEECPGNLKQSFFTNSGTEADETGIMVAQLYTGKQEIIALRHAYSGRSFLAQAVTAHSPWRCVTTQVPFIKHAHSPYCYRCDLGLTYPSCELKCAYDIEVLIKTTTTGHIAGFIAEPIQGVGGFIVPPLDYFKVAAEIIRKYGGLIIIDEVQTGFGRTGNKMWGIEHFGITPDVMTMAKGVANGLPMGVTVTRPEIAASVKGLTISTFGGNPVSCAAATATMEYIKKHKLPEHVHDVGTYLREGLEELRKNFPAVIGDVRGMGLMQALELVMDETKKDRRPNSQATLDLFEATKKRGLLIGKGGLYGNVIRISPPMTVTKTEINDALRIMKESFQEIAGGKP